jgi:integrase
MIQNVENAPPVHGTMDQHLSAALLCTLGKWWCKLPKRKIEALEQLRDELKPPPELCGMTPGNRKMLDLFDDHALGDRLLKLPFTILEEYVHRHGFSAAERVRIRRATMVTLQSATAMRPNNLASLAWRHLSERGDKIHIQLPAAETKNKVAMEFILPARTARMLRFYLAKIRPLLLVGDNDHLWPGADGKPLTAAHVGTDLGNFTEAELGVRVTGHRFRHVMGYLYLLKNPNGHEVVRLLLGHRKITTTQKFYASLTTRHGYQIFDNFVTERLEKLGHVEPAKPHGGRRG